MEKIRHDPLRINVKTVHHDELASQRFNNFSLGYTSLENPKVLERLVLGQLTAYLERHDLLPVMQSDIRNTTQLRRRFF